MSVPKTDDTNKKVVSFEQPEPSNNDAANTPATTTAPGEAKEEVDLSQPPPPPEGQDFFFVDFRTTVEQLSQIDTVESTAHLKYSLVFYWTDPRLIGWEQGTPLPDELWGPYFDCYETTPDTNIYTRAFGMVNSKTGRVKRTVVIEGTVLNPMNLRQFPFDSDDLVLRIWTASTFRTLDESKGSPKAVGRDYELRPLPWSSEEGQWLTQLFSKTISDWQCPGISTCCQSDPPSNGGQLVSNFTVRIHLWRKSSFYVWKALVPTWLLGIFTFKTFVYPIEDLGGRDGFLITLLLATFAMMYVTDNYLPKTDFLTSIDKITIVTIFMQFIAGLTSTFLYMLDDQFQYAKEVLEQADVMIAIALAALYLAAQYVIVWPQYWAHKQFRTHPSVKQRMVLEGGYEYFPVGEITPWLINEEKKPKNFESLLQASIYSSQEDDKESAKLL